MFGFDKLGAIVVIAVLAAILFFPAIMLIGWLVAKAAVKGTRELDRKTFSDVEASDRD